MRSSEEYKVFRGDEKQPTSEVMAEINFVPPTTKTYKITEAQGNSSGEKMVRALLDRETGSAKKGLGSQISRANYDFVFLREETFGVVPEHVLRIVPKRKDKNLLRGQTWVDTTTFRIRRIEGVPAKSPSFWIEGIHITLQFADVNGMWISTSFRRHRYRPPLRALHSGWPHYPSPHPGYLYSHAGALPNE
jgi:hypothetical protein